MKSPARFRGFTIVELLVVIVVIGILAGITIVAYSSVSASARDKSVLSDVDSLDGIEANIAVHSNDGGVAWYSGPSGTNGVQNATLQFTPSQGNIVDVVVSSSEYCIRIYNKSARTYNSLTNAATKGTTPNSCANLTASSAALADSPAPPLTYASIAWTARTGAGTPNWYALASSANGNNIAAVANGASVVTSSDSGVTWTVRSTPSSGGAGIASSSDGQKLLLGALDGNLYTSSDGGATWVNRFGSNGGNWGSVSSSADGSKLVAAWYYGYIYTSLNSGVSWTKITSIGSHAWGGVSSSADGQKILLGDYSPGDLYTSTDSGATWTEHVVDNGSQYWEASASSADGTKLLAGEACGSVFRSNDSGASWTKTSLPYGCWFSAASSADGTKLVAANKGGYIYTSIDSGTTWTQQTAAGSRNWWGLATSSDGSKLFAADRGGNLYTGAYN